MVKGFETTDEERREALTRLANRIDDHPLARGNDRNNPFSYS